MPNCCSRVILAGHFVVRKGQGSVGSVSWSEPGRLVGEGYRWKDTIDGGNASTRTRTRTRRKTRLIGC